MHNKLEADFWLTDHAHAFVVLEAAATLDPTATYDLADKDGHFIGAFKYERTLPIESATTFLHLYFDIWSGAPGIDRVRPALDVILLNRRSFQYVVMKEIRQ